VGFTESRASVEEKGIISIARRFGNSDTGRLGKLVVAADDKGIETVLGIEVCALNLLAAHRRPLFLFRLFLLYLVSQEKLHIIVFIKHFRDRDLEENFIVIDNIVKHDRFI
jgi:hypothetical protein